MKINHIGRIAGLLTLLALATGWPAVGQAPGSVHGWWEGTRRIVPTSGCQKTSHAEVQEILDSITAVTGDRWKVTWDPQSGYPREMRGRTAKAYTGSFIEAAEQFVEEYRRLFIDIGKQDQSRMIEFVPHEGSLPGIVVFRPLYDGIPMLPGGPSVVFDTTKRVIEVRNSIAYPADYKLPKARKPKEAFEPLLSLLAPDSGCMVGNPQRLVYPTVPPRIAYQCTVNVWVRITERFQKSPHWNEFIVDASTGEVLSVRQSIVSEFPLFPLSGDSSDYLAPTEDSNK